MSSKILIVDDDKHIRNSVSHILQGAGYDVVVAESGKEGLNIAGEECPQAILLDIEMPDMTGIDFLKVRAQIDSLKMIPILMLTARDERVTVLEVISLGADDYIIKPVRNDILLQKLKVNLARQSNLSFKFPSSTKVMASVTGEIIKGSEVEIGISIPIRFGGEEKVNIHSSFFDGFDDHSIFLNTKGSQSSYEGKNRFQNLIKMVGMNEDKAYKIRRKIMSWKG